jgi:hypothetical protein
MAILSAIQSTSVRLYLNHGLALFCFQCYPRFYGALNWTEIMDMCSNRERSFRESLSAI